MRWGGGVERLWADKAKEKPHQTILRPRPEDI